MHSVDFVLEVEDVDEVVIIGRHLLLRYTLSIYLRILVQVHHRVFAWRFAVESVSASLVDPYAPGLCFVGDLGLLDKGLDHIFDSPSLGNKYIIHILCLVSF